MTRKIDFVNGAAGEALLNMWIAILVSHLTAALNALLLDRKEKMKIH